jgi:hypothetical protein
MVGADDVEARQVAFIIKMYDSCMAEIVHSRVTFD